jgi:hypothetical protein
MVAVWAPRPSEPRELWLVDVSGDEPGVPVKINAPLAPEESVFLARVDRHASLVVYETTEPMPGPRRSYYVDLAGGEPAQPLGDGVDMHGLSLFELPP